MGKLEKVPFDTFIVLIFCWRALGFWRNHPKYIESHHECIVKGLSESSEIPKQWANRRIDSSPKCSQTRCGLGSLQCLAWTLIASINRQLSFSGPTSAACLHLTPSSTHLLHLKITTLGTYLVTPAPLPGHQPRYVYLKTPFTGDFADGTGAASRNTSRAALTRFGQH